MFNPPSPTADPVARKETGFSHVLEDAGNIFEMFSESETELGPEVETRASRRVMYAVVESFDSNPEGRSQARLDPPTLRATPAKKNQLDSTPKEMNAGVEGQQSDNEVIYKILEELKASSEGSGKSSQSVIGALRIPIPRPRKVATAEFSPSVPAEVANIAAASSGTSVMPHPVASRPAMASLPKLRMDANGFFYPFSLKALQDAEKAFTELYQAQQMTKVHYESFISFYENRRDLRDRHLKVERQANKVRCYKGKHIRTSTTLQQLVEEGSTMDDRIMVVAAEIQKLEEQLYALKVEQMTLPSNYVRRSRR
ncbi:hypothetical protein D8674_017329 [Pyrus ussuriensis x Pyrus communis]|uniref:TMV resistance protein N-like n=1 Tax=Pyrus ussuriensis x Pyrus communis TaxID=2448454 RepID=A0A5N5HCE4_9ROSA|nr:hypothetical protein D8674_017329 [Pyrus ussuriensis x Pyrus communis]